MPFGESLLIALKPNSVVQNKTKVRCTGFGKTDDLGSTLSLLLAGGVTLGKLANLPHLSFFISKVGLKSLLDRLVVKV